MNAIPVAIALALIILGAMLVSGALPLSAIGQAAIRVKTYDVSGKPVQGAQVTIWATYGTTERKVYVGQTGFDGLAEAQLFIGDPFSPDQPIPVSSIGQPLPYRIEVWHSDRGYHETAGPFQISSGEVKTHVFNDIPANGQDSDQPVNGEDQERQPTDDQDQEPINGGHDWLTKLRGLTAFLEGEKVKIVGMISALAGAIWIAAMWRASQIKKTR